MKRRLEILNQNWNHSHTNGEVHPPRKPEILDKHKQGWSKWWSLPTITKESSWQIEFRVEQVCLQHIIVSECDNCAEKGTETDLTCSGMGHSFCTIMRARTRGRLWPIWLPSTNGKCYLTRHTASPPDFDLFSKLKESLRAQRFSLQQEVSSALPEPSEDWTKLVHYKQ